MILIAIDKNKKQPLFQQISNELIRLMGNGTVKEGDLLPSTRKLAEKLEVNRATVYRAYEELWAAGYIESTQGGYTTVRKRPLSIKPDKHSIKELVNWDDRFSKASKSIRIKPALLNPSHKNKVIDFTELSPDHNLMPVYDFRKCINEALKEEGADLLDYSSALGYRPLREYLPKMLGENGIRISPDEIAITNGMQNGLDLILRLLTNPGDEIITESPTYSSMIALANYLGTSITNIPMIENGMDLDVLEDRLKKGKAKLIYTMPTFHNPTGLSTSQSHRELLLALSEKYQIPIIEDGFEEEMKYFGKAVLPIKSMDNKQMVIYLGTFSKVLFPGIRVGWIAASPAIIQKLAAMKQTTELSNSALNQAAIYRFCSQGLYELHKKRIHRAYRKRMQTALQSCREFLDAKKITYTRPDGGYLIWFTVYNRQTSEETLFQKLLNAGVAVTPGSRFYPQKNNSISFRLSIAKRNEEEIRTGIQKIAETIQSTSL